MVLKLQYFSKNGVCIQFKGSFSKTGELNVNHEAQNVHQCYEFQKFVSFSIVKSHRCQNWFLNYDLQLFCASFSLQTYETLVYEVLKEIVLDRI